MDITSSPAHPPSPPSDATPGDNEPHTHFTFVLALLAIVASALAAILAESQDTVGGWTTAPKVVYGVVVVASLALLAVGIMAAARHATAGGTGTTTTLSLSISDFCAKLSAVLSSAILVVVVSCKLGTWGCFAGVPPAAVIACIMAAVWTWGDERAAARAVSDCWSWLRGQRRQPA